MEQVGYLIVVGQQGFQIVVMIFSLQDFIVFNGVKLVDYVIGWYYQYVWIGIQWVNVVVQWVYEEIVEGVISCGIWFLCFFYIDFVVFYEQIDDQFCQLICVFVCILVCEVGELQFRQNVLQ